MRALRRGIRAPLNILASPETAPLPVLQELGVHRVSFGPFLFRWLLGRLVEVTAGLRDPGPARIGDALPGEDAAAFLREGKEVRPGGTVP